MVLKRLGEQVRNQDWYGLVIVLVVIITGVVIGLQVDRWIDRSRNQNNENELVGGADSVVALAVAAPTKRGPMNDLETLVAIEEIKKAKARYFRAIDTKEFDLLYSVFTEDAVVDMRQAMHDPVTGKPDDVVDLGLFEGRPAIVELISGTLGVQTVHHGHNPEIDITSETTATGIWPMEDIAKREGFGFRGYGHYRETYVKTDEGWRIKTSLLTRTLVVFD